jgi:hypothetical protein
VEDYKDFALVGETLIEKEDFDKVIEVGEAYKYLNDVES